MSGTTMRGIATSRRLRLDAQIALPIFLAALLCMLSAPIFASAAEAAILIRIDKPTQTMTVSVNGDTRYRWKVSTGASGYSTPTGNYSAFRMEKMHYSQEWDGAGMPHSIFFTSRGHAIHGSNHPGMGTPRSHGCVRLSLQNAATLYNLVEQHGMAGTKVVVAGSDPAGNWAASSAPPAVRAANGNYGSSAGQVRQRRGPFGGLFRRRR